MNKAFCNSCMKLVDAERVVRDGKVFLKKNCPQCGESETLVSSDSERHYDKRDLDSDYEYKGCTVNCPECDHHPQPLYAFVDVTNRCNQNCPMCADNVPSHGFVCEPPIEHFEKIFDHLATFDPQPTVALFGGEPTVRKDLVDIVNLSKSHGFNTRVLTNGLRLADEEYCRQLVEARARTC